MRSENSNAIVVSGLGKVFRIYNKPIDRIKEIFTPASKVYAEQFVALEDVSFKIEKGEFIGIIGKNGAGKSTLLKILSGELNSTMGEIEVNGTISLLQLGVGFNKELNGIENIKFAAKINGVIDKDIDKVINNVIDFSELGDFIYRPVKYYSSGMYSRLSFAVGINIDPDILIADEVIAVGDIRFASKCLRKMQEFKKKGKTVIIVTHDINKVSLFCDRAMWLNAGKIEDMGEANTVIEKYRDYMLFGETAKVENSEYEAEEIRVPPKTNNHEFFKNEIQWKSLNGHSSIQKGAAIITHAAVYSKNDAKAITSIRPGEHILIYMKVYSEGNVKDLSVGWILSDKNAMVILHSNSKFCNTYMQDIKKNKFLQCCFDIKIPPLRHSEYLLSFGLKSCDELIFKVNDVFPLQIVKINNRWRQGGYVIVEDESFFYEESNAS